MILIKVKMGQNPPIFYLRIVEKLECQVETQ